MEIKVSVTINKSPSMQTFMVMAEDEEYDEVFGLESGLRFAISDFVSSFNRMGYQDSEGEYLTITNEDIVLPKRSEWIVQRCFEATMY